MSSQSEWLRFVTTKAVTKSVLGWLMHLDSSVDWHASVASSSETLENMSYVDGESFTDRE